MLGVDIVSIDRIERILNRSGIAFLHKFLNDDEIKLCVFKNGSFNIERIAGFYATKEAVSKALGCGISKKLTFSDIIISKHKNGRPIITLKKHTKKYFRIKKIHISISHERGDKRQYGKSQNDNNQNGYAIAIAMAVKK